MKERPRSRGSVLHSPHFQQAITGNAVRSEPTQWIDNGGQKSHVGSWGKTRGEGKELVVHQTVEMMNQQNLELVQRDRATAQQHPLFKHLARRNPPGGWMAARCVAAQLENKLLPLPELSKLTRIRSMDMLRRLLTNLPEIFDFDEGQPPLAEIRFPDQHMQGCPWHSEDGASSNSDSTVEEHVKLQRCHCVWRLCDALQNMQQSQQQDSGGEMSLWGSMSPKLPARTRAQCNGVGLRAKGSPVKQQRARPVHDLQ